MARSAMCALSVLCSCAHSIQVGVTLELTADPMEAAIEGEWRRKTCEWWIWDCKWAPWHVDTLWQWSAPRDHEVLYERTWPIRP